MNLLVRAAVILLLGFTALFRPPPLTELATSTELNASIQWDSLSHVDDEPVPPLDEFIESLARMGGEEIIGIYVPETLAMPVVQQPEGAPQFVSPRANVVTQFELASRYGTTGFLAHNHLAGAKFHLLDRGQFIYLISQMGSVKTYVITEILHYQALTPWSFNSEFRSLDYPSRQLSAVDLFYHIYGQREGLVLQTCIRAEDVLNWGRLFVIAVPIDTWWHEMLDFGH